MFRFLFWLPPWPSFAGTFHISLYRICIWNFMTGFQLASEAANRILLLRLYDNSEQQFSCAISRLLSMIGRRCRDRDRDGDRWRRMEDAITNYNNSPRGNFSAIICRLLSFVGMVWYGMVWYGMVQYHTWTYHTYLSSRGRVLLHARSSTQRECHAYIHETQQRETDLCWGELNWGELNNKRMSCHAGG